MFLLPLSLDVLQVAQQDLVVDSSPEVSRFEEVHAVQVRDVHSSLIGRRAVRAVLLNVHAEKTHVCSVDVLKRKQGFHPVREGLGHLSAVNKPGGKKKTALKLSCCAFTIVLHLNCLTKLHHNMRRGANMGYNSLVMLLMCESF